MTVGIPGTGISLFFYLISVFVMLLYEVVNKARQRSGVTTRRIAKLQIKIFAGAALSV